MKIKLICGFRKDQEFSIDAEEAHKAYYLFFNPEARSVFNSGLALKGADIQRIEPDYHGTIGWSPDHKLEAPDWEEIRARGLDRSFRDLLVEAKNIAQNIEPQHLALPLSEVKTKLLT